MLWLLLMLLSTSNAFLWYSPVSRSQTLEDCLLMKENKSPFYPPYCDRLILKYNVGGAATGGVITTAPPPPEHTVGWGWSAWGEWIDDACPEVCGRRCRVRRRHCTGPYNLVCAGRGKAYQFEDCPALEDEANGNEGGTTLFQRGVATTTTDFMRLNNENREPTRRPASSSAKRPTRRTRPRQKLIMNMP